MPLNPKASDLIPMLLFIFSGILAAQKVPFPVEETSIASLETAYLAGRTTVHEVVQRTLIGSRHTTNAAHSLMP